MLKEEFLEGSEEVCSGGPGAGLEGAFWKGLGIEGDLDGCRGG